MSICPACKKGKLSRVGDTYQCDDVECGYIQQIQTTPEQNWILEIAKKDRSYWKQEFFDELPTFIAHEYRRLWVMALRPNVFCMVYQLKDVCEVLLKFPVLCAAAYLDNDAVSGMLVKKPPSIGDWIGICDNIIGKYGGKYRYDIPQCLRNILEETKNLCNKIGLASSRNDYLSHGAMGFDDNEDYRKFSKNCVESIADYLSKVMSDYAEILVTVGAAELKGWRVPKNFRFDDEIMLHIANEPILLEPYIVNSPSKGLLFFDNYKYGKNNQTAYGLDYIKGGGRKSFIASYYHELYCRRFKNQLQSKERANINMTLEDSVSIQETEAALNSLNEADSFVRPEYIIKWIGGKLEDSKGSVNLLMMERGMGKTALSYALASGEIKEFNDTYICAYYCGQSQMRSDYITGINNALRADLVEVQQLWDKFVLLDSSAENKKNNMLESLEYFRSKYSEKRGKSRLLLIIDGLDELPLESAGLFDYLPDTDDMPDDTYILLTSRNPDCEELSEYMVKSLESLSLSDKMVVGSEVNNEHGEENFAVLKQYAETKIHLFSNGDRYKLNDEQVQKILTLSRGTFLNIKLYAKLAESGIAVENLPELDDEALFRRYLDEIKKYYGDKLFDEAITTLYAIITARESLTMREIAWITGDKCITVKLLAFIRDFGALLKTTRDKYRGSLISAASERYCEYIEKMYPEKLHKLAYIFTEILCQVDIEQYKDKRDNYNIPDGLVYIAAYLPTLTDYISEELVNTTETIDKCIENTMKQYILYRRAKMGEVWRIYCEKSGLYNHQLNFMKTSGDSYLKICESLKSFDIYIEMVYFSKKYFLSGKIHNESYIASAYFGVGLAYALLRQSHKALEYYNQAIELMERLLEQNKLYDENELVNAYINRGVLNNLKKDKLISDYSKSISLLEKMKEQGKAYYQDTLVGMYHNRGLEYRSIGQYDNASNDLSKCIEISKKLKKQSMAFDATYDLGYNMFQKGLFLLKKFNDEQQALAIFNQAIAILEAEIQHSKSSDLYSFDSLLKKLYNARDFVNKTMNDTKEK